MKIGIKLFLGFFSIVLLVVLVGYFSSNTSQKALQKSIEENTLTLAVETMDKIDRNIYSRIEDFQAYSSDLILQKTLLKSNQEFEGLVDLQFLINKRDKEWTSVPEDEITAFMKQIMSSSLSKELIELLAYYKNKYGYKLFGEVFVTNKYGANIAQSGKTTDYRQDDEAWWLDTKRDGLSIRDVKFDKSAGVYSTDIGIRVDDEYGNFIGVIKSVLNIAEVIGIIKELKTGDNLNDIKATEYTLITKEGNIVFSTKDSKRLTESTGLISEIQSIEDDSAILIKDVEQGDTLIVHAHSRGYKDFEGLGWIFIIEQSTKNVFVPVNRLRENILITSLAAAVFAILMSYFISRSIAKPIIKLRTATKEIGKGSLDVRIDINSNDEIGQLSADFNLMTEKLETITVSKDKMAKEIVMRKKAEEQIKASLQEKEVLLQEIHHRVKNNMQIMASLLRLQSKGVKDKHLLDLVNAYQNRIKSMALIHEDLYRGKDLGRIDLEQYTRTLTDRLTKAYEVAPNRILTSVNIDNVLLGVDTAIPCGLIINELFTNSLKYAFPIDKFKDKKGEICIECHSNNTEHTLVFSDNGVGLPEDIDIQETKTMGLDMIVSLVKQLKGTIEFNRDNGTEFKISFKCN